LGDYKESDNVLEEKMGSSVYHIVVEFGHHFGPLSEVVYNHNDVLVAIDVGFHVIKLMTHL
jgi:hypothetical protein